MLSSSFSGHLVEVGCDEAGRGCLAGPVFAAAVILPLDYKNKDLNDSKKLTEKQRDRLRVQIENDALAWAVTKVENTEIDKINILNASFLAMHRALAQLHTKPQLILVDGNRFKPYGEIPHKCIIKGDGLYLSIAAASVLAKTHRDAYMMQIHKEFPIYGWFQNKGYPTLEHRKAVIENGFSPHHRRSFSVQLKIGE